MKKTELLKKLLPGFIPLFVFIAADEIWGTKIGLIVAVAVGLLEMIWIGIREKRFDKFILFDTVLLVVLGGVSIILNNDIFFKLKPGLIELIFLAILGISAFSSLNIVSLMSKRYMGNVQLNETQIKKMAESLKILFYLFAAHALLVFYATFYMSKEAWAFISGGLFYIIFGVYFLVEFIRNRVKQKSAQDEEWLPLVNEKGEITGQAPRSKVHDGSKLLHPVVHMHVIKPQKAILLQKRAKTKQLFPGKWDTAVGGHISTGEKLEDALKREAYEEIGLKNFSARLLKTFKWESDDQAELVYLFTTFDINNLHANQEEVEEIRFWTKNQIKKHLNKNIFTPTLEHEFLLLKQAKLL